MSASYHLNARRDANQLHTSEKLVEPGQNPLFIGGGAAPSQQPLAAGKDSAADACVHSAASASKYFRVPARGYLQARHEVKSYSLSRYKTLHSIFLPTNNPA